MMYLLNMTSPAAVLTSDASGNWGCGAYYGSNWFMLLWSGLNSKRVNTNRDSRGHMHMGATVVGGYGASPVRQFSSRQHC